MEQIAALHPAAQVVCVIGVFVVLGIAVWKFFSIFE